MELQGPISITPSFPLERAFYAQVFKELRSVEEYESSKYHIGALWQRALALEGGLTTDSIRWILGRCAEEVQAGPNERKNLRVILYRKGAEYFHLKYKAWLMEILATPKGSDPSLYESCAQSLLKDAVQEDLWSSTRFVIELSARLEMNLIQKVVAKNEPDLGSYVEKDPSEPTPAVLDILQRFTKAVDPTDPEGYDYMHAFMLLTALIKHFSAADNRKLAELMVDKLFSREIVFPKELVAHIVKALAPFKVALVFVVPPGV